VFLFAVLMLILIIGTAMYLIEGKQNGFENIPKSIYWAIITLTTVGYGDVVPHTVLGQIFAGIVMITGYGIIAVPTGIVTAQVIYEQKERRQVKCSECGDNQHSSEARFCKSCGNDLPVIDC
jgi:voltage-gated potassium channel